MNPAEGDPRTRAPRAHSRTHPNVATKWFSTAVQRSCCDAGKVQVARQAVGSVGFGEKKLLILALPEK